jgi:ribonucleoside-diphosphate reductase alpha chain
VIATAGEYSRNALQVLDARYLRRDEERRVIETPQQLFARVAAAIASAESLLGNPRAVSYWEEQFYRLLVSLEFLPNSPMLMNAGTPMGQLSACFVLPVPDTMEGIFDAVKNMALIQRTGGGTGFAFSRLRPKGDVLASTGGEASGPVSFMKIFDCVTENIKQGGRRRGANMGVLRVDHPDILEFINGKLDGRSLQNFNISVGMTDAFLQALREDDRFALKHPGTGRSVDTLPARQVFDVIVDAAWRTGDPGLVFLDTINRANPTPHLGEIEATNPCGEIPLLPYEACTLGSINLARMLREPNGRASRTNRSERGEGVAEACPEMDWEKLRTTVRVAIRFLDNAVELNRYPTQEIAEMCQGNRKLGLGVMGLAEMFIRLGIAYDSSEAIAFADRLMHFIAKEALETSHELAIERGAFRNWKQSVHAANGSPVRNATLTAIAPTGTIGIIANTTPGIEPLFALAYRRRNVLGNQTLVEVNPLIEEWLTRHGLDTRSLLPRILEQGTLKNLSGIPADFGRLFSTALEIPVEQHLQIQAAFQRHVDNSVSKTINLPHDAARQDVAHAYLRAAELGLKGITVYRYASKTTQVLELGAEEKPMHYDHASRCDPDECRV